MTGLVASAPGKLFLCGEYAVLEGAPAVLTAIDRRAVARVAGTARRASPVVAAVLAELSRRFKGRTVVDRAAPPVTVQTRGFVCERVKMGLGSSSAVAVAVTALLLAREQGSAAVDGERILEIALAAHRAAQGGRGSGADVAAAVYGGTIRYAQGTPVRRLEPVPVAIAFVWTGRSASTTELLGRVQGFAQDDPAEHDALLVELKAAAAVLAAAYAGTDAAEIVRLTFAYGALMARLGERAGAAIVSPAHARVARLAADYGGAGKPSGAGAGDVSMAVFARVEDRDRFATAVAADGLSVIDLRCHERGVEVRGA